MKRPAVFFDRDNTLIVSDGYLGDPAGVVLIEGAADAVARARQYGFKVITFSNQSGVARGMFTEEDVQAVNQRLSELLQEANPAALIEHHEYCPFHPEATVEAYKQDSFLRKPKPGMILQAAEKLNLDLARSWVIGDAPRDIEAGRAAGCRTILFTDPKLPASPAAEVESEVKPDFVVSNLREAVEIIGRESLCKPAAKPAAASPSTPAHNEAPAESTPTSDASDSPTAEQPKEQPMTVQAPTTPQAAPTIAAVQPAPAAEVPSPKLERLLEQLLVEMRRREEPPSDFSVSKLLAGIVQIIALAVLFVAYLRRDNPTITLMYALILQTLTIALLIMGRQK
ncbi:MAG TPA: HAD-IIIA family hydrolase [Tepidisphaeraceae bacterium]|nr:HAD-IIIA family hydrolase [Tepidisphaeraceae bacterium]